MGRQVRQTGLDERTIEYLEHAGDRVWDGVGYALDVAAVDGRVVFRLQSCPHLQEEIDGWMVGLVVR